MSLCRLSLQTLFGAAPELFVKESSELRVTRAVVARLNQLWRQVVTYSSFTVLLFYSILVQRAFWECCDEIRLCDEFVVVIRHSCAGDAGMVLWCILEVVSACACVELLSYVVGVDNWNWGQRSWGVPQQHLPGREYTSAGLIVHLPVKCFPLPIVVLSLDPPFSVSLLFLFVSLVNFLPVVVYLKAAFPLPVWCFPFTLPIQLRCCSCLFRRCTSFLSSHRVGASHCALLGNLPCERRAHEGSTQAAGEG